MRNAHVILFAFLPALGCQGMVAIEADCTKVCLNSPGPTLPAVPMPSMPGLVDAAVLPPQPEPDAAAAEIPDLPLVNDGGLEPPLDAGVASNPISDLPARLPDAGFPALVTNWTAEMRFNEVLDQLPTTVMDLSTDVRLVSVKITSLTDLSFIESVEVYLTHGKARTDGGTSTPTPTPDAAVPGDPLCKTLGSTLLVATYLAPEQALSGPALAMVVLQPKLNVFPCMKDVPSYFQVRMTFRPGTAPTTDAPLTLTTCIQAGSHVSYP